MRKSNFANKKIRQDFASFSRRIKKLKRCQVCILPETFPHIEFDKKGVCNYCRTYKKHSLRGKTKLALVLKKYHRSHNKQDCLVTFSGGRDSSYGLYYLKRVMKMNPVAYTYDWGMTTDLGVRNQSRMVKRLGVKQLIVRANLGKKLRNIRKNVLAWLKRPDLGIIPLFMAGDKQYFYYANKISQKMGIKLIILCLNPLEKTDFKFVFCGIKPDPKVYYRLNLINRLKLILYYAKAFISNPSYINVSLFDMFFAFASYYFIKHDYLSLYDYIQWDEREVEKVLINDFGWETARDTKNTWRIGDGTASFYNYIYYVLAGFTENDTFRSNQIREGSLTRNQALKKSENENRPRWESIQWYCDTIGIDPKRTIEIINRSPKLYEDL